eukprot:1180719-Prorocentrum_minimum.AAC.4
MQCSMCRRRHNLLRFKLSSEQWIFSVLVPQRLDLCRTSGSTFPTNSPTTSAPTTTAPTTAPTHIKRAPTTSPTTAAPTVTMVAPTTRFPTTTAPTVTVHSCEAEGVLFEQDKEPCGQYSHHPLCTVNTTTCTTRCAADPDEHISYFYGQNYQVSGEPWEYECKCYIGSTQTFYWEWDVEWECKEVMPAPPTRSPDHQIDPRPPDPRLRPGLAPRPPPLYLAKQKAYGQVVLSGPITVTS